MPTEVKIPSLGDSIVEIQIGRWLKSEGDYVDRDETLVELDTDKSAVELPAPIAGRIVKQLKKSGDAAQVGDVVAHLEAAAKPTAASSSPPSEAPGRIAKNEAPRVMPAAQRELAQRGLSIDQVAATGPGGRMLKEDVVRHATSASPVAKPPAPASAPISLSAGDRAETVAPMSLIRKRIAERLVQAQHNAALLTTFNEVDMSAAMALRKQHQDAFQAKHGVKLGFMSIFVRAVVDALKTVPQVNAELRGNDIVHRNYCDIGVAIGGGKGLVVPILRNAEKLNYAQIELAIADFAKRAAENKLSMDELAGGTFTISNGGIYGSLLSTPIVNPPQSGILGMHAIQERPIAVDGQVVVRPMMYIALTYDHRLIDGREAVTFLKRIKEVVEAPVRMLLEI